MVDNKMELGIYYRQVQSKRRWDGVSEHFLDLTLDSRVPDAKTIWLFRSKLEAHKLTRKQFDKFNAFLAESGFVARKGQIVDATIVKVPIQLNPRDENKAIKEGNPPAENRSEAKKRQKDTDTRWVQKNGKNYYGYKNHVEADVKYKIIRACKITLHIILAF